MADGHRCRARSRSREPGAGRREPGAGGRAVAAGRPRSAPGPPPAPPAQRPPRPEAARARHHSGGRVLGLALSPLAPDRVGMLPKKAGSGVRPLSYRIFGPWRGPEMYGCTSQLP